MQNIQQHLFRRIWASHTIKKQEPKDFMVIRGNIINIVRLTDINKNVSHNQEVCLTENEVRRSKDLENAIKRQWVQVLSDKSDNIGAKPQEIVDTVPVVKDVVPAKDTLAKDNEEYLINMAKKMASAMAEEMLKNSPMVKEMAREIAKEMASGINDTIGQHIILQGTQGTEKIPIVQNTENNVFVDLDEKEILESNIENIGKVEIKQDGLSNSLEKLKRFKRNV